MSDARIEEDRSPNTRLEDQADQLGKAEPDGEVAEALAQVQQAVADMKDGGLRESLETAIEVIDSACGAADESACEASDEAEGNKLGAVADALEEALDELEKGKVANLLPVIEQAQSIVRSESSKF